MLVESVFRYRTLQGKCDLGIGLDWDEIDEVAAIEHAFAPSADDLRGAGRRSRRASVSLGGIVRGDQIHDRVGIDEIGLGGAVLRRAPYIARGEAFELVIEQGDTSYRFCAQGIWLRDDGDDYRVGLAFRGMPVCVRRTAVSPHAEDLVDRIAA